MALSQTPLTLEQIGRYAPSALATRPYHAVSSKYTFIPTVDIIRGLMKEGFQPYSATQSRTRLADRREFTKHMIKFRRPASNLAVGDLIPEATLTNGHDTSSAYNLMLGIFRLACLNGLMVSENFQESIKIPHKGDILSNVIEGTYRIIQDSDRALDAARNWGQLQLTAGEQTAFARSAHVLRFGDTDGAVSTPFQPEQLLAARRSADTGADLWSTFNRVQENAIKGGIRARTQGHYDDAGGWVSSRRVKSRAVKGIDQDIRLNRALWHLAEEMAKLKTAA